ncbi:MAG: flagellar hook-basal body complex protein [Terracidiphilus sp.]|jgi:flagellar hook protein FlgE
MPSFYIPLSGLDADSTALNTIANNLANMNTTGFKSQTTNFSDLFYQQVGSNGSGDEVQQGTGVKVASNTTDFSSGSISSTDVSTDNAIDGTGFFVLNAGGGSQLYTQDGSFQLSSTGTLETADGLAVMGYPATNGVVNTSGGLSNIVIPTGQVSTPSATTNFSMTQNLDSQAAVGAQATGQVQVFDSLGNKYEATVTYTNQGSNTWGYSISIPDTLTPTAPAAATITNALTEGTSTTNGTTTLTYDFGSSGGKLGTVDPSTSLALTAPTGTPAFVAPTVTSGESVATYAQALQSAANTANIAGVTVASTAAGKLTITGAGVTTSGSLIQSLAGTSTSYTFGSSNGALTTVDPGTNLTITGPTALGGTATLTAPGITAGESVANYVAALNTQLSQAGITGVAITGPSATGQVTINSLGTSGSVIQDPIASANATGTMSFNSSGNLITPAGNLSGLTFSGFSDNASPLNLTWDLYGSSGLGNVSQTAAASSTSATNQNGYAAGQYESFAIDSSGVIAATYSNGQTQNVGQLAIATVSNEQGLVDQGSTEYQATTASGDAAIGVAGNGGRGTIEGSSLEASNVNISAEFSDLIVAQRAFEANSKAVTTFDTVTQETINMIH